MKQNSMTGIWTLKLLQVFLNIINRYLLRNFLIRIFHFSVWLLYKNPRWLISNTIPCIYLCSISIGNFIIWFVSFKLKTNYKSTWTLRFSLVLNNSNTWYYFLDILSHIKILHSLHTTCSMNIVRIFVHTKPKFRR